MTVSYGVIPCGLVNGTQVPKDPDAYIFQVRRGHNSVLQMKTGVMSKMLMHNYQHTWCHVTSQKTNVDSF